MQGYHASERCALAICTPLNETLRLNRTCTVSYIAASIDAHSYASPRPPRLYARIGPCFSALSLFVMLAYHTVDYAPYNPEQWAAEGLRDSNGTLLRWHPTLPNTNAPVVVVDTRVLSSEAQARGRAASLPPEALCNVDPYRQPTAIRAAGGYVVPASPRVGVPVVLAIHRLGVWDLPKGKQDPGESLKACAEREVREEVGIETVHTQAPLGITSHGYETYKRYVVKTTHWFLMKTPATTFTPQVDEQIARVAWARWPVLLRHIGYESLRTHMKAITARVEHLHAR